MHGWIMHDDPLMPIGSFSRASLLSVKALRSYHEQGLLVPAEVDAQTGYRSYLVSQLTDAAVIRRLRDLDVPLRSVHEIVHARDPEVTRKVVAEHETVMRERLADLTQIVSDLQEAVHLPALQTPVHRRTEPATHALTLPGVVDCAKYAEFLDDAYVRIWTAVTATGAVPTNSGSALYPAEVEHDAESVVAYVAILSPVSVSEEIRDTGVRLELLPETTCAVATHIGGYDTIGDTYSRLGAWVARNDVSADQPIREHYVVSVDPITHELLPPEQRRTEISWPVQSITSTTEETP